MIDLSPKAQFRTLQKEHHDKFANLITEPAMRTALTHAFAELGFTGITTDELNGAKKFMVVFSRMAEPDTFPQGLPPKNLHNQ